jgi:hypothetical protein
MDARQLILLPFMIGGVGLSYPGLTATLAPWTLRDGRLDLPDDQETYLSRVVHQLHASLEVFACHPTQTHRIRTVHHVLLPGSVQRTQLEPSWPDTQDFRREMIHETPFQRAAWLPRLHSCGRF